MREDRLIRFGRIDHAINERCDLFLSPRREMRTRYAACARALTPASTFEYAPEKTGVLSPRLFSSGATVLRSCSSNVVVLPAVTKALLVGLKTLEPLSPLLLLPTTPLGDVVGALASILTLTSGSGVERVLGVDDFTFA